MAKANESGEPRQSGVIVTDADLVAKNAISKAMKPLTQGLRDEVAQWFIRKYGTGQAAVPPTPEQV